MIAPTCRVCSAPTTLLYAGRDDAPTPEAFQPTNHRPGEHGDLYRCPQCGTVQQPALPSGAELHDLYRDMADAGYLEEAEGRRASAVRLLDLIGKYVPGGTL